MGAVGTDNYDNSVNIVTSGSVDSSTPGIYEITYSATDSSGNIASVKRTVTVINNIKPTITINGVNPVTSDVNEVYNDLGATAVDYLGNNLNIVTSSNVDINTIGDYIVTYQATDSSNNVKTGTRIVKIRDRVDPIVTLIGDSVVTLQLNQSYTELGANATDNHDLNIDVIITGSVNTAYPGSYTKTYTATDDSGNSDIIIRTINV